MAQQGLYLFSLYLQDLAQGGTPLCTPHVPHRGYMADAESKTVLQKAPQNTEVSWQCGQQNRSQNIGLQPVPVESVNVVFSLYLLWPLDT